MSLSSLRVASLVCVLVPLVGGGWLEAESPKAGPAPEPKAGDSKPAFVLPKNPKEAVVSYDPGAGRIVRKGKAPYLRIQADGEATVTTIHNGATKTTKLTSKQLDELLRFILQDNDFFTLTQAKIADSVKAEMKNGPRLRVTGAGTSVIHVQANGKTHEVSYQAAGSYLRAYPKARDLARFAAVEKRLSDLAASIVKGK